MIHLIIDQKPLPKERPRFNMKSGHAYTTSKSAKYESHIKQVARAVVDKPLEGPLEVKVIFNFEKAKSSRLTHVTKRPDIDNLLKGVLDALNGVAYIDDAQIVKLYSEKNFSSFDHIEITICSVTVSGPYAPAAVNFPMLRRVTK